MVSAVQFDPVEHVYTQDGVVIPSVTQILEEVGLTDYDDIPRRVLARKSEIGLAAHLACELLDEDDLVRESVPASVMPYVAAYERFKAEAGFEPAMLERRMVAELNGMKYGMTPDRVGLFRERPSVLDLKCAAQVQKCWGIQLAGYALGLPRPKTTPRYDRYVIWLRPDETYRVLPFADVTDEHVFQWSLGLVWWKRNAGY
jgi:hypothetical protein